MRHDAPGNASRAWRRFKVEEVSLLQGQIDQYVAEVTPTVRAQTVQDKKRVYGESLRGSAPTSR